MTASFGEGWRATAVALAAAIAVALGVAILLSLCQVASADQVPHDPIEIKDVWSFNAANGVSAGSGTAGDPYVIEGWSIANASGITIRGTAVHFVIRDVSLKSPYTDINAGIWLYQVSNGDIENVSITGYSIGIDIISCTDVTVKCATVSGAGAYGLLLQSCRGFRFDNVTATGSTTGIQLMMCDGGLLDNCTCTDCADAGISLGWRGSSGCNGITLQGCVARRNPTGIYVSYGSGIAVRGCVVDENSESDLHVESSPTTIDGNRLGKAGLDMGGVPYLQNVSATNTVGGAPLVYLVNRSDLRVVGPAGQVLMWGCDNVTLEGISFDGMRAPVTVMRCTNTRVVDCSVSGAFVGLCLLLDGDANITGCTFDGAAGAFGGWVPVLIEGPAATFRDCSFSGGGNAIIAWGTRPLTIVNSTFQGLEEGINLTSIEVSPGVYRGGRLTVDGSSFLDCGVGMLLYDWDVIVNGTEWQRARSAGVRAWECDSLKLLDSRFEDGPLGINATDCYSVRVEGCEFRGPGGTGIYASGSSGTVKGCIFDSYEDGLVLYKRSGFNVYSSNFTDITWDGILVDQSVDCMFYGRFVRCGVGIHLYLAASCTVVSQFEDCGEGLRIEACQGIQVVYCDIERSKGYALNVSDETSDCFILHNILKGNNLDPVTGTYKWPQAWDTSSANKWDKDGEGNFWDDMQTRYPDAKPLGRVWDTPYDLAGGAGAADRFPLTLLVDFVNPTAVAGSDMTVDYNATFELNGSASMDDIGIVFYQWMYFDGVHYVTLNGPVVQLAIQKLGTVTFTLTVKDAWGNGGYDDLNVTVVDREPPVAVAGDDITVEPGMPAVLNASASSDNVGIAGFAWTIDPSGLCLRLLGPVVAVNLPAMGDYLAVLDVFDTSGNEASDDVVIHVTDLTPPVAVAGLDLVVDQGAVVTFDGSLSSDNVGITGWTWAFDYGGMAVTLGGPGPEFRFDVPGVYVIVLTVRDEVGNAGTASMTVTVRDTRSPVVDAGPDVTVDPGEEVTLSGAASSDNGRIADYLWTVPRDVTTYEVHGVEATVSFPRAGAYQVRLKVTDSAGNWATDTVVVNVRDVTPPTAKAGADITVDEGATVALDGGGSLDDVGIVEYSWTFNESGSPVTLMGPAVTHSFAPGSYAVTLRVKDAAGNAATDTVNVTVLSREVAWALGPFLDKDGKRLPDATVTVRLNGTTYNGTTNATGWLVLIVKRHDLVSPAGVTASKKGYRTATSSLRLDADGRPIDPLPRLEREKKSQGVTPGPSAFAAMAAIAAVGALCGHASHRISGRRA